MTTRTVAMLASCTAEVSALALRLRDLLLEAVPGSEARTDATRRAILFRHPVAGPICSLLPEQDRVTLTFERGAQLPDPGKLLRGTGRLARHLELQPGQALPVRRLRELLTAAVRLSSPQLAREKPKAAAGSVQAVTERATAPASPRIGSEALLKRTGKGWDEWFRVLDSASAATLPHRDIVALLAGHADLAPWWRQMIAVSYEQARGLREKHQRPDGHAVSRSLTFRQDPERLFEAWTDAALRRRWLGPIPLTIRSSTPPKTLRLTFADGTQVEVEITATASGGAQLTISHSRLFGALEVDRLRAFWGERLNALADLLAHRT
jgi:hypothetical protein